MFIKIRKILAVFFTAALFLSCSNLFESIDEKETPSKPEVVSVSEGKYSVSLSLIEADARTVLPEYSYENCKFDLYGTVGEGSDLLLFEKVSYAQLVKPGAVKIEAGTWTFTVECFNEENEKILSGTSIPVNITSDYSTTIQIPMIFITGTEGSVEINLTLPCGSDIATVSKVKAGLYNSPLAAAGDSCEELTITDNGGKLKVTYAADKLESGLTKYIKFFVYSELGVELGRYTEAVIIGDNLTSKADLELTTLRAANVLTLTLKTNGSTYTGEAKDKLVLKSFPEEEDSYPMTLTQGTTDTYSAKIINGIKYILYDGDYNTKLIYIPTATETSDGIVEYCTSIASAAKALTDDEVTTSGLGLLISDTETNWYTNEFLNASGERKNDKVSLNLEECTAMTDMGYWYYYSDYMPMLVSLSCPKNNVYFPYINGNNCLAALFVNEGVKNTENREFYPPQGLECLSLPSTLEKINCFGLGKCVKLRKIIIPDSNEYFKTDGKIIMSKDGKTMYSYPSANGDIVIPEGITSMDSGVFSQNVRITGVSLPSTLEKIGDQVFYGCTTLRKVQIPEGVTSIGQQAFYSCSNLKSVNIPEGVTSIGHYAFYNCSSLEKVEIPSTVKRLGYKESNNSESYVFGGCYALKTIILHEGLEEIGPSVFYNCYNLKTIELPSTLNTIDEYAFASSGLTSIVIPDSVETIGNYSFQSCNYLEKVMIGSGVNNLGSNPFRICYAIKSLEISSANAEYESIDNCIYTKDGKTILYYNWDGKAEITIPEGVENLGHYLFYDYYSIKTIELPSSIISIGEYAFFNCYQMTNIRFDESLTSIGDCAFYRCGVLTELELPESLTSIGVCAFADCYNLSEVEFPEALTSIGECAFADCDNLINVKISEGLTSIGRSAFISCDKLSQVEIPESVTRIEEGAFEDCPALESMTLPPALEYIGDYAFENSGLKEISIPGSVTYIGPYSFSYSQLEKVYFEEGIEKIENWGGFYHIPSLTAVYWPKSLTSIRSDVFNETNNITDIYYAGTETEWGQVTIPDSYNGSILTATVHYESDY